MKSMYRLLFVLFVAAMAYAQQTPAAKNDAKPAVPAPAHKVDRAAAYYHYSLAHMYEEQVAMYGRSELATMMLAAEDRLREVEDRLKK